MNNVQKTIIISIDGMAAKYLEHPKVKVPNLRYIMNQGASCKNVTTVFPTSTWTIHTSMVTGCLPGKHGVLGNAVFDRRVGKVTQFFGDREYQKDEEVHVETLYDVAKKAGLSTASICWPVTRGALAIDWNIPEFYEQELFEEHSTQSFWHRLKEKGFPVQCYGEWSTDHGQGHLQDKLTLDIASFLVREEQPDLMFLHFLLIDSYHHDYGNDSPQVYWAIEFIDQLIGQLLDVLKVEKLVEETNVFLLSDHGLVDTTKTFFPNRLFRKNNLPVFVASNRGSFYVYLPKDNDISLDAVIEILNDYPEVSAIFEKKDFEKIGLPREGQCEENRPDLVVTLAHDTISDMAIDEGPIIEERNLTGHHGHLPNHLDLVPFFLAYGPTIQNIELEDMKIIDLAPTIAASMKLSMPKADGEIQTSILVGGE